MANLFDFDTPEQVRARIGKTGREQDMSIAGMGPAQAVNLAGAQAGRLFAQALGGEHPEVTRARNVQSVMSQAQQESGGDLGKYYGSLAKGFSSNNMPNEAFQALAAAQQYGAGVSKSKLDERGVAADEKRAEAAMLTAGGKTNKPPKVQEFKTDDAVVQARWTPGFPDAGYGEGWEPITTRKPGASLGEATLLGSANTIRQEFDKKRSTTIQTKNAISSLRSLLDQHPDAINTRAVQTKLTEVFSTSTKAIAEVEAWRNRGSIVQRVIGSLNQFTKGTMGQAQYDMIRNTIDQYEKDVVDPSLKETTERYKGITKAAGLPEDLMGFGKPNLDLSTATDKVYDGDNPVYRINGKWVYEDGKEYGK